MAKRTAVAAPAAAIDDDLPWDKPKSDDETANLFDTGGERGLEDDANDEPSELEERLRASLDESDLPVRKEDPTTEILEKKPVGSILTDIALQGISARMRKKPLPAHSNEWVVATYRRMAGLREVTADESERSHFNMDCTLLKLSADRRGISVDDSVGEPAASSDYEIVDEREPGLPQRIAEAQLNEIVMVAIEDIAPDRHQARDEGADDELADLIKANGFYQSKPIELRVHPLAGEFALTPKGEATTHQKYMIVDGERRYRGALKAGHTHVPAMIIQADDEAERLLRQVNSNQGKPLKPLEEARTWKRIMDANGWTAQQLADRIGKKKSTVGDRLAILEVPVEFVKYFEEGVFTAAAAPMLRPLTTLPDRARKRVIESIVNDGDFNYYLDRARQSGKPMKLTGGFDSLENEILGSLNSELRVLDPKLRDEYKGKTVAVGKVEYAVDVAGYDAVAKKAQKPATAKAAAEKPQVSAAQRKANEAEKERRKKDQLAREREKEAREKKDRLRGVHFAAVAAKVPDAIDAGWALMLIAELAKGGAYDMTPADLRAIGITLPKSAKEGERVRSAEKLVVEHAKSIPVKGRIRLALQLLAYDPDPWGKEDRLVDAARLAKVDLAKVREPEFPADGNAKASSAAAKKSAKKR